VTDYIHLRSRARATILQAGLRADRHETGGILVGFRDGQNIIVTRAIEVPSPNATSHSYRSDHTVAQIELERDRSNHPADLLSGYVGEWHTHPAPVGPSWIDRVSIGRIAWRAEAPIALVVCHAASATFWGMLPKRRIRPPWQLAPVTSLLDNIAQQLGPLPPTAVNANGPVFLSYRQSDGKTRVRSLELLLRASGLVIWRDQTDLRAGTTDDRLESALTNGLSAAVLIVTPHLELSEVVRTREAPRLIQLDEHPDFSLAIANEVTRAGTTKIDYGAPDRLLGHLDEEVFRGKKQSNGRALEGRLQIVRDLLLHRMEVRRAAISDRNDTLDLFVQTRPAASAMDADLGADLHIRTPSPPGATKVPTRAALNALRQTLPLASDAAFAAGARNIAVRGGAHLSIAITIGAAFPETKFPTMTVAGRENELWSSDRTGLTTALTVTNLELEDGGVAGAPVAVLVTISPGPDTTAFATLIRTDEYAAAVHIGLAQEGTLLPDAAGPLAAQLADIIRATARGEGTSSVHLAFQGPFPIAVLLGRLLNTLRTTTMEWDDSAGVATYLPTVTLLLGTEASPIVKVHV